MGQLALATTILALVLANCSEDKKKKDDAPRGDATVDVELLELDGETKKRADDYSVDESVPLATDVTATYLTLPPGEEASKSQKIGKKEGVAPPPPSGFIQLEVTNSVADPDTQIAAVYYVEANDQLGYSRPAIRYIPPRMVTIIEANGAPLQQTLTAKVPLRGFGIYQLYVATDRSIGLPAVYRWRHLDLTPDEVHLKGTLPDINALTATAGPLIEAAVDAIDVDGTILLPGRVLQKRVDIEQDETLQVILPTTGSSATTWNVKSNITTSAVDPFKTPSGTHCLNGTLDLSDSEIKLDITFHAVDLGGNCTTVIPTYYLSLTSSVESVGKAFDGTYLVSSREQSATLIGEILENTDGLCGLTLVASTVPLLEGEICELPFDGENITVKIGTEQVRTLKKLTDSEIEFEIKGLTQPIRFVK